MKQPGANHANGAFTVIEFLAVLVSLGVLLVLIMPALPRHKGKAPRVMCTSSLKQVTLGFLLWANENGGQFPMQVSVSAGGSKEHALAGNIVPNYTVAAGQIGDPRVLICPSDKKRKPAPTFATLAPRNISYFLNIDAIWTNQQQILAGDRDLALTNSPTPAGLLPISDPYAITWGNILHKGGGNVAFVDGGVHQVTSAQLRRLVVPAGTTNRMLIP